MVLSHGIQKKETVEPNKGPRTEDKELLQPPTSVCCLLAEDISCLPLGPCGMGKGVVFNSQAYRDNLY